MLASYSDDGLWKKLISPTGSCSDRVSGQLLTWDEYFLTEHFNLERKSSPFYKFWLRYSSYLFKRALQCWFKYFMKVDPNWWTNDSSQFFVLFRRSTRRIMFYIWVLGLFWYSHSAIQSVSRLFALNSQTFWQLMCHTKSQLCPSETHPYLNTIANGYFQLRVTCNIFK